MTMRPDSSLFSCLTFNPERRADLEAEALADRCAQITARAAYLAMREAKRVNRDGLGSRDHSATIAGRDFWYTRNGHGCGFWDGDWPEPHGDELTTAAKAFREIDAYVGDDGKVYLS